MSYQTFSRGVSITSIDDSSDYILSNLQKGSSPQGMSVWSASVFITSFMAGMGVLSLPYALAGTGWCGMALIVLACVNSLYSSLILGRTWLILEERWSEYKRGKFRYPYPAIGERAVGRWMRYVVAMLLHATLIGVCIVYILLAAQIAQSMTKSFITLDYSYWIIILAVILCPMTWFGSIEEFWVAAVGALITASLACFGLFGYILSEIPTMSLATSYSGSSFASSSLAFGTILFAFGGSYVFPTIQNDMANRQQFNKAAILGFTGLLFLYLPVTIAGYAVLGNRVTPNILHFLDDGWLKTLIEVCLAVHILLAMLIAINPTAQEAEEVLGIDPDFNLKRCILRTVLMAVILTIAHTIPHFDKILNLIGGSTMTLLTFIFPPLFYIFLTKEDGKEKKSMFTLEYLFLIQIMICGALGGISCTFFAVKDIINVFVEGNSSQIPSL